jgi:hypothetical protein
MIWLMPIIGMAALALGYLGCARFDLVLAFLWGMVAGLFLGAVQDEVIRWRRRKNVR